MYTKNEQPLGLYFAALRLAFGMRLFIAKVQRSTASIHILGICAVAAFRILVA